MENIQENNNAEPSNNVKLLELEYEGRGEVRGFNFVQLISSEYGYVYKVVPDYSTSESDNHYEVFIHRVVDFYGKRVSYPSSVSFGTWAWTFKTYSDALNCFECLKDKINLN